MLMASAFAVIGVCEIPRQELGKTRFTRVIMTLTTLVMHSHSTLHSPYLRIVCHRHCVNGTSHNVTRNYHLKKNQGVNNHRVSFSPQIQLHISRKLQKLVIFQNSDFLSFRCLL